jgi:hypothetical protein
MTFTTDQLNVALAILANMLVIGGVWVRLEARLTRLETSVAILMRVLRLRATLPELHDDSHD